MFTPDLADIRFGCGRSPRIAAPGDVEALMGGLRGPDDMAAAFPIEPYDRFSDRIAEFWRLGRIRRQADEAARDALKVEMQGIMRGGIQDQRLWITAHVARWVNTETPLRERLARFWADHFTVYGKRGPARAGTSPFIESAIRPRLAGRFEDLLIAAALHPMMLYYLDQHGAAGPNSPAARRNPGRPGLNENLARELMELHTLGVNGPYTQDDVRQLAELLTGLVATDEGATGFRPALAEPGAETVLGQSYGGTRAALSDIHAALRDLARHPATARHIAGKLAVHFVSDRPDPALIDAMEAAWRETDGDLTAVYRAMLGHPAAWDPAPANAKPPFDYVASACRALDVPAERLGITPVRRLTQPLRMMGEFWEEPAGPDGLPEEDDAWLTPQGLAARLQWGFTVPQLMLRDLPDPRDFVLTALGGRASDQMHFAAGAAETRADGIGVVLASPAFQRR